MDINELESFKLSDAVKFHKELNPCLWQDEKLDSEVRDQLLLIAEDFVEYLGISNLKVKDVTISGSNAAYSYTPHSDLDLHVLVDFDELPDNEVYQELFTAKKTLYNDAHDITVHGVPVELYVQDINQPVQSLGEYSIVHDKWIRIPKKRRANFDEVATKAKYEKLGDLIELALKTQDPKRVADTIALVKRYRKSGLDKHGEFGPENLAYKAVRKQGLVQALYDLKSKLHAEKLSIEEAASRDDALIKIKKLLQTAGRTPAEKDNIKRIVAKMMQQWNIDPSEIGVRQPVDPLKAKIAKAAYEKNTAANMFKQEWERFKKGIFAEEETDEDYDPNGPPPGPEFKPTMPAGTVRVDVSDVYDWYKLGQHISNMKGLGKHDFGKGPPSTILSFGDEDTEHKYIQDLEKTGLTTTDIDPVDPKQPKGMKRQKTDPTYNVNEDQYTFAGKDPMSFKSPNGGTPTMLLVTGQGSRYLVTSDGMVLRNKSFHASTGGEDQGLKDWSGAIEFYDPNEKPGGAPFALTVSKAVEKKLPVALSNTKDGKRALLIHDGKQWRVAKVSDVYNNVASTDDPIVATYSKTPKLNWNVFDYDVDANNRIVRAHPGSPVTHGIKLGQPAQVSEASGYIPSEKEKNDPRFKTALTVDVKPDAIKKNAKAFGFKTSRAGIPPQARADGKIAESLMNEWKAFLAEDETLTEKQFYPKQIRQQYTDPNKPWATGEYQNKDQRLGGTEQLPKPIHDYVGTSFGLNKSLVNRKSITGLVQNLVRRLKGGQSYSQPIKELDALLSKSLMPQDTIVYHGTHKFNPGELAAKGAGKITIPSYLSTSTDKNVAYHFSGARYGDGHIIEISLKKGQPAFNIGGLEGEVLLPRNTTLQIDPDPTELPGKSFLWHAQIIPKSVTEDPSAPTILD